MMFRVLTFFLTGLLTCAALPVASQGLRPGGRAALNLAPSSAVSPESQRALDFIVAIVNSEPITNHDLSLEMQRVLQQLAQARRPQPDLRELQSQVLERLISEKAQLQLAKQIGIRIEPSSVDQAEQSVAAQNQIDVPELRRRLALEGIDLAQFQGQLRDQLALTRLREREVEPRVRVSNLEVDQYIAEQTSKPVDPNALAINLAQVLVAVPDAATPEQVDALQTKAQDVLKRARAGDDFATLARTLSDAQDRLQGGQLGLRTPDRYPPLFIEATRNLEVGGVSEVVRSGAGFHVLKVIEKRQPDAPGLPPTTVTQSRARHILLRLSSQLTEAAAVEKLNDFKRRIETGLADFASLARDNSQDSSAAQGGDLGWASPGQFVPEFEGVMNRLAPGQLSNPLISRFGVHLIQLIERRNAALSEKDQREMVRGMLREKKLDDAFIVWAQEVRARAYVEIRELP